MMELVVMLSRATNSSIDSFLKLPISRLNAWANATSKVLERENGK